MKNIFKITIIASLIVVLFAGCEEFLDVNDDPNNATEATAGQIFPAATASAAGVVGGEWAIAGTVFSQYATQANASNQYKNFASLNVSSDDLDRFSWEELYSGALNDFKAVKEKAEENSDWSYYLMATTMQSYIFQMLADLYNQIPYSEALQGADGLNPAYDAGETVYDGILSDLNEALGKNLNGSSVSNPGDRDFIFQGNLDDWVRFANTLKLKIYLRQRYVNDAESQAEITAMFNNGDEFLDKDANMDVFVDQDSKSNPFYESDRRQLNTPNNLRASETMFYFFESNSDPRLEEIYMESSSGGYEAMPHGGHNLPTTVLDPDDISVLQVGPTDPVPFISEAESYFLQAEAALIYGLGDPKVMYDQGVLAAFAHFGLDGSSFIDAGGDYEYPSAGSQDEKLEAIITQKWAALAQYQGMEAWTEWRRTGYPDFFAEPVHSVLAAGEYIQRLPFPDSEYRSNTSTPTNPSITSRVWWDVTNNTVN